MIRAGYFLRQAWRSTETAPMLSILTTLSIGVALSLLALYALTVQNMERLTLTWGRNAPIVLSIADTVPDADWDDLANAAAQSEGVESARLVLPDETLARFRARGPDAAELVAGVDAKMLPATIDVQPKSNGLVIEDVTALAQALANLPGVANVDYGQDELAELTTLLNVLRILGLAGALLLVSASVFIVGNTIRIAVYARRDEIAILQLVGATRNFVRLPFMLEGTLWGLGGALMSVFVMGVLHTLIAPRLSESFEAFLGGTTLSAWDPTLAAGLMILGLLLGVLGSSLAVRRFLDVNSGY